MAFHFVLEFEFRQNVIESQNIVNATICIIIVLKSDSFGGMSVKIEVHPTLERKDSDDDNEFLERGNVLDTIVLVLLTISSLTYINSIIITFKLYKVNICYVYIYVIIFVVSCSISLLVHLHVILLMCG